MASYLLFFPRKVGASPDLLRNVGLGCLLRERGPEFSELVRADNPAKAPGMLAGWPDTLAPVKDQGAFGFDEKLQTWVPCAKDEDNGVEEGDFWIVLPKSGLLPASLSYEDQRPSVANEFLDGNAWLVPRASAMPRTMHIDRQTGKMTYRSRNDFDSFSARAAQVGDAIMDGFARLASQDALQQILKDPEANAPVVDVKLEDAYQLVCDGLAINYRLHWQILNAVDEFFDDRTCVSACMGICDYHTLVSVGQKKTDRVTILIGSST